MKYLIIIIVVLSMTIPSYGRSGADEDSVSLKADSLVNFAKTLVGTTYKWGGTTPQSGFDCSGFCRYVFTNSHVKVPRTSASYGNFGTQVQKSEARKGDVILFRGTDPKSTRIGHIGIVISNPGAHHVYSMLFFKETLWSSYHGL
ncbi:MAG: C40 family peptidase [Flavobacteriales bacterium]|nr:C40 family peptidase [Flavobacteriales bacterium]